MLYREIMAVCSEIQTKPINKLCGQNVELLNVKLAVYTKTIKSRRVSWALWTYLDGVCPCLHLACNYTEQLHVSVFPSEPSTSNGYFVLHIADSCVHAN